MFRSIMEDKGAGTTNDRYESGVSKEMPESDRRPQRDDPKSGNNNVAQKEAPQVHSDPLGEVNMEATIDPADVIRAGGFGARDDISSLLPVASDSTDFEASLLDARDYEEPREAELHRPGLGWKNDDIDSK